MKLRDDIPTLLGNPGKLLSQPTLTGKLLPRQAMLFQQGN